MALVPGHLVDDAPPLVLAGVGGVQVLLDGSPEEALQRKRVQSAPRCATPTPATRPAYLTALTGDAAVVVARGFVPAHHAQLVLVQVAGYVPCRETAQIKPPSSSLPAPPLQQTRSSLEPVPLHGANPASISNWANQGANS